MKSNGCGRIKYFTLRSHVVEIGLASFLALACPFQAQMAGCQPINQSANPPIILLLSYPFKHNNNNNNNNNVNVTSLAAGFAKDAADACLFHHLSRILYIYMIHPHATLCHRAKAIPLQFRSLTNINLSARIESPHSLASQS